MGQTRILVLIVIKRTQKRNTLHLNLIQANQLRLLIALQPDEWQEGHVSSIRLKRG